MKKHIFDIDKYNRLKLAGVKGKRLAIKLGYSCEASLSRAKRDFLKKNNQNQMLDTISVIEKIKNNKKPKENIEVINNPEVLETRKDSVDISTDNKPKNNIEKERVVDLIDLIEEYLVDLIKSTPARDLETQEKIMAIASLSKTMSSIISSMVKINK